ncbi:Phospholipase/carboxylesterase [Abortiporus biennis]|nr:Phospholipase/carboxylesterase [Abortiporus biennis]
MSSQRSLLSYASVAARTKHTATVIFVHGLGDSGYGWQPVADMFSQDPALNHVKWILPHAPKRPVTVNGGTLMPAWFDILSFNRKSEDDGDDEEGMLQSRESLIELIKNEVQSGIPSERIVLGGFSQGGVMTLLTGLTSEQKLGGLIVLSARLALKTKMTEMITKHATSLPIFWGHGQSDPIVKYAWGVSSAEFLTKTLGVKQLNQTDPVGSIGLNFHTYPSLPHSTSPEEMADLHHWLVSVLPEQA